MTKTVRVCHQRKRFETIEQAKAVSASISRTKGQYRLPEPCHWCNGYHLAAPDTRHSRSLT